MHDICLLWWTGGFEVSLGVVPVMTKVPSSLVCLWWTQIRRLVVIALKFESWLTFDQLTPGIKDANALTQGGHRNFGDAKAPTGLISPINIDYCGFIRRILKLGKHTYFA